MGRFLLLAFVGMAFAGGGSGAASATDFTFGPPEHLTAGREVAGSVAIGDANGDGRMDLAVTEDLTEFAHRLAVYLQRTDGSLAPPITLTMRPDHGWGFPVMFADMDGDGTDEILTGDSRLGVVRLAGGELVEIASAPARYGCAYLASGDIDSDGRLDIACHSTLGMPSSASVFYGDGFGGLRATIDIITDVGSYGTIEDFMDIQLADVTGDDRPDLLVTASKIDRFFVYPNDGNGAISEDAAAYAHPAAPSGAWPAALEALDIDGDGDNEVVTVSPDNQPDASLNIYRRDDRGSLVLSERRPVYDSTTALISADVDGDADLELLAGHYLFNAVTVLGANAPGIASQASFELPGFGNTFELYRHIGHSKSLALGDLDSDGCADLAAATFGGVTLLRGCRPPRASVPVNDFDGDGFADIMWRNEGTAEFQMWQWADLDAWYTCAWPCAYYKGTPWVWQAVGDFNGDGSSDVFWRDTSNGENAVMLSSLYSRRITAVRNMEWSVAGAGDFDGDDRSDLLWRNHRTGSNVIWHSADYSRQSRLTAVRDLRWQVAGIGDFNGDGRSDIVWHHGGSGRNTIWLSGGYRTQQPMVTVTDLSWRIQGVGDFNGDGEDDIAWRKINSGRNVIWLSGDYWKQQATTGVTDLDWTIGAVGDYDDDGRDDLMWRNYRTGANVIWHGGNYREMQRIAPASLSLSLVGQ